MGSVVGAGQVGEIKVRVDLRGGDVGVTEQLLHAAQILTRFKQMGGEGMTEEVWIDAAGQSLASRPLRDAQLDRPRLQSRSIAADEQRRHVEPGQRRTFA